MNRFTILIAILIYSGQIHAQSSIQFEDVSQEKSINYAGKTFGSTWGDINGDALPDLFLSGHANGGDLYQEDDFPVIYMNNGSNFSADFILNGVGPNLATGNDWHGAAFFDVDKDGDLDMLNSLGGNSDNTLYLNENGLVISDVSDEYNLLSPNSSGRTPGLLDINSDGYTDIITNGIAAAGGPPRLFLNQNGNSFEEVSSAYNLNWSTSVFSTTSDLNNDGGLNLLSLTSRTRIQTVEENSLSSTEFVGGNKVLDFIVEDLNGDLLPDIFHVRGDRGVYVEQINSDLIRSTVHLSLSQDPVSFSCSSGAEIVEFNLYPRKPSDSYVVVVGDDIMPEVTGEAMTLNLSSASSNVVRTNPVEFPDIEPRIYISYDSDSQQWEVISKSGTVKKNTFSLELSGTDLVLEDNYPASQNLGGELFYNQGNSEFLKDPTSIFDENDNLISVVAADFDNDMDLDLYTVRSNYAANKQNILWENTGNGQWSRHNGAWGAEGDGPGIGENVTTVDYNNDGFMDLFVTNGSSVFWLDSARTNLYENQGNDNNWIKVQLKGVLSDPMGLNAKVILTAGDVSQLRYQNGGMHRFSQNDTRLHFGLAQNETVTSIEVFWPSGIHQVINNVDVNQILTIEEEVACENPYPVAENLSSEVLSNGVLLKWQAIPGSFNCQVNGGKVENSWNASFLTNESNSTEFFVPQAQLQLGSEYRWRVRCACTSNIRGAFTPFHFFTWGIPSQAETQQFGDGTIYPNPVRDEKLNVHIDFTGESLTAFFYDMRGKLIKQEVIRDPIAQVLQFDLTDLAPGVYLLNLTNGKDILTHKIMKQ